MLSEWQKFAGWRVLEHFLARPGAEPHIKELARLLKMSPRSVQVYCDAYENDGIFFSERKANARLMRLDNRLPLVQALKKAYFLARLNEAGAFREIRNMNVVSLALYGSRASGTYVETSDIDLLVVSERKVERTPFLKLAEELGGEVQLTEMPVAKWHAMKKEQKAFALSVLSNNVLLQGVEL